MCAMKGKESEARQSEPGSDKDGNNNGDQSSIRFPRRLLVRMTTEERRALGRKADAIGVSN